MVHEHLLLRLFGLLLLFLWAPPAPGGGPPPSGGMKSSFFLIPGDYKPMKTHFGLLCFISAKDVLIENTLLL